MDLAAVNEQIVLMRNAVRRAKVHIIRKLTRNISKLNKKKGTEEQINQNKKRSKNQLESIDAIKALNVDDVSRFALINGRKFAEIASKGKPNDRDKVMTRLAETSVIRRQVNDFRKKYPKWESELPYLLKMRLVRSKFKNANPKNQTNSHNKSELRIAKSNESEKDEDHLDSPVKRMKESKKCKRIKLEDEEPVKPELELTGSKKSEKLITKLTLNEDQLSGSEEKIDQVVNELEKDKFVAFMNEGIDKNEEMMEDKPLVKTRTQKRYKSPIEQNSPKKKRSEKQTKKAVNDTGGLHPSWEAKKRITQNVQFQGTKIKFD